MNLSFFLSRYSLRVVVMCFIAFLVALDVFPVFCQSAFAETPGQWKWLGGPSGGLGYDIRMHPDNKNIMFVTDALTGVYKSTDGGQTWSASNNGITSRSGASQDSIPCFCLTIDPNNPDIIWSGMTEMRGVYKSTDQGKTWTRKESGIVENLGLTSRGFTVKPGDSQVVYMAAEISSFVWAGDTRTGKEFDLTKGVVYKTVDGGENWQAVWRGENLARYIWINPDNTDVVYVSTGIFDREAANSSADTNTPGGEGVLKSTDGGQTWSRVNNGLGNLYVGSLFMHPEDPDTLLAGTGNNAYQEENGVYLTTDGGATWRHVLKDAGNISSVEFCLSNPQIAYAGSIHGVYRSEDGGRTWQAVAGGGDDGSWGPPNMMAGFPIDFQVDPDNPDRIFANNYGGGNFLSTDGGHTWVNSSKGYTGASVKKLAVDRTDPGRVVAGVLSGFYISRNGGDDWSGLYPAGGWYAVAIDPSDPNVIMGAISLESTLFITRDDGQTWTRNTGATLQPDNTWRSICFSPSSPSTIYAGSCTINMPEPHETDPGAQGIFVSHDRGTTWSEANDATSQTGNVWDLDVAAGDDKTVMAATTNLGVLKTTDGGTSWMQVNSGLPTGVKMLSIAIHPTDPKTALVGSQGNAIYRTTDGGQNWNAAKTGMIAEGSITDIVFNPQNPQEIWAADMTSGIYRSTDGGQAWVQHNSGLLNRTIYALAISKDGNHVYAGTDGSGTYRLDVNGTPPAGTPDTPVTPDPEPGPDSGGSGGGGGCFVNTIDMP